MWSQSYGGVNLTTRRVFRALEGPRSPRIPCTGGAARGLFPARAYSTASSDRPTVNVEVDVSSGAGQRMTGLTGLMGDDVL
jgi:hypothetical protein